MPAKPKKFGIVLFEGFQLLDVCGPLDAINVLSTMEEGITLSIVADASLQSAVSTMPAKWPFPPGIQGHGLTTSASLVPTHTFTNAPQFDVLLVPGGVGCRNPSDYTQPNPTTLDPVVKFIQSQYPGVQYLITICTGSAITSLSGVLDGKKATTNKRSWDTVTKWRREVDWVHKARWVRDGNCWTSSGVSAGIDVTFAFIQHVYGETTAANVARWMEYTRKESAEDDPFARNE